jgi:RNA polymerase sigma-70 factor (sigma-E family)
VDAVGVPGSESPDAAFQAFVLRTQAGFLRLGLLLVGDHAAAEDLVQAALARTYARWERLSRQDPAAYTRKIIVNASNDRWRRTGRHEHLAAAPPDQPARTDPAAEAVDRDAVLRALNELTVKERRVIVLRYFIDLSEAETARELDIALGTVKSTAHRALGKLRASTHLRDLPLETT